MIFKGWFSLPRAALSDILSIGRMRHCSVLSKRKK